MPLTGHLQQNSEFQDLHFYRDNDIASVTANKSQNNTAQNKDNVSKLIEQAASVACVLEDEDTEEEVAIKDAETLPLYNFNQKETVKDVVINPELSAAQQSEIRSYWMNIVKYSQTILSCQGNSPDWAQSWINWNGAGKTQTIPDSV